ACHLLALCGVFLFSLFFFFHRYGDHQDLHSFPTRRSSDLELGLKSQGQFRGDATGGKIQGATIKGVEFRVQGAKVSKLTVASFPFPTPPGFEFDGIIGCDFIKQFVVEVDYLKRIMNLYNPRTYRYVGSGKSVPLILIGQNSPLVDAKIFLAGRVPVKVKLEVDTGGDNAVLVNSPFVKRHKL